MEQSWRGCSRNVLAILISLLFLFNAFIAYLLFSMHIYAHNIIMPWVNCLSFYFFICILFIRMFMIWYHVLCHARILLPWHMDLPCLHSSLIISMFIILYHICMLLYHVNMLCLFHVCHDMCISLAYTMIMHNSIITSFYYIYASFYNDLLYLCIYIVFAFVCTSWCIIVHNSSKYYT